MNQTRRQAYQNLIQSLFYSPNDGKLAILQANLELLDDEFAQYFRDIVKAYRAVKKLSEVLLRQVRF